MKKSFLIILILNFMVAEVCASAESTTEMNLVRKNENDFRRMKHALLMENMPLVDQIQEENSGIWSYADPKTGQMLIHEVFTRSYPLKSIEHVIHSTDDTNMNAKDSLGNRPLHYFVKNGDSYSNQEAFEIFKLLNQKKVRCLSKNNDDVTPLHLAAQLKNYTFLHAIISILPENYQEKGYLDWKDNNGKTPLMYAFEKNQTNNVLMLLDKKAVFDQEFVEDIQNYFDKECQKEIEEQNIFDPEKQDEVKQEYMKRAHEHIVRLLVQAKKRDKDLDFDAMLKDALKSGVDINKKDPVLGNTLLHWAMNAYIPQPNELVQVVQRQGQEAVVNALLAFGANFNIRNRDHWLPDTFGIYEDSVNYYKNLQNSLDMHENRKTLFGESIMNAYERWLETDDATLLTEFLRSPENQVAQLIQEKVIQEKARSFFQPEFVKQICN